jgi:hypothetical protein
VCQAERERERESKENVSNKCTCCTCEHVQVRVSMFKCVCACSDACVHILCALQFAPLHACVCTHTRVKCANVGSEGAHKPKTDARDNRVDTSIYMHVRVYTYIRTYLCDEVVCDEKDNEDYVGGTEEGAGDDHDDQASGIEEEDVLE